jgi:hypothetical protein
VLRGRLAELEIKLKTDIANWTWEDSHDFFVAQSSWLGRWFFGKKINRRIDQLVAALKWRQENWQKTRFTDREIGLIAVEERCCQIPPWERWGVPLLFDFALITTPLVLMALAWG